MKFIPANDRQRFRILARGLEFGLHDEEWRSAQWSRGRSPICFMVGRSANWRNERRLRLLLP